MIFILMTLYPLSSSLHPLAQRLILSPALITLAEMVRYPVQKFTGLVLLYTAVIFGIFTLQFRNETAISLSLGSMRVSLTENQSEGMENILKNVFALSFRGIAIAADDGNPLILVDENGERRPLSLRSWQQNSPVNLTLTFDEGASLSFIASGTESPAELSVSALLPEQAVSLELPYKPAKGYSVTQGEENQTLFVSQNNRFALTGIETAASRLIFTPESAVARYAVYVPPQQTVEVIDITALPVSSESAYAALRTGLENTIARSVSSHTANLDTETNVVTALAVMAKLGAYRQGLAAVPASFKQANGHSYLSAPFLGSVRETYASLIKADADMSALIRSAASAKDINLFSESALAPYLLRQPSSSAELAAVVRILSSQSDLRFTPVQAAGFLSFYVRLKQDAPSYANSFESYTGAALAAVREVYTIEEGRVMLVSEAGDFSLEDTARIGQALIDYGKDISDPEITAGGFGLINSTLADAAQLSFNEQIHIYAIIGADNPYMPRFHILRNTAGENPIWAWSCASNIAYRPQGNSALIQVDFPVTESHYIVFKNIPRFNRIQMYDVDYRSDSQFEIYDAPGYVYDAVSAVLYLKSRHKAQTENIRLTYGG